MGLVGDDDTAAVGWLARWLACIIGKGSSPDLDQCLHSLLTSGKQRRGILFPFRWIGAFVSLEYAQRALLLALVALMARPCWFLPTYLRYL